MLHRHVVLVALFGCSVPACADDAADTGSEHGTGGVPAGTGGALSATGGTPGTGGSSPSSGGTSPATGGASAATGGTSNAAGGTEGSTGGMPAAGGTGPEPPLDFDAMAADFTCLQDWNKVRNFRITNTLGLLDEALAVANDPAGGRYPVGTIIQLVTTEAMVKRADAWSPETNDWEFFFLDVTAAGTQIVTRGRTEVVNQFGGNCFTCHNAAEPQFDLVCEANHGCAALPVPTALLVATQDSDPRCN